MRSFLRETNMGDAWPRRPWMRGRTPQILQASRWLRSGPTPAEEVLWQALRKQTLPGLRFRRQHAIGRVILDFYCPAARLALEVDGGVHDRPEQAERDEARTDALNQLGIRVLRIRNEDVLTDLVSVLHRIQQAAPPQKAASKRDVEDR